MNTGGFAHCIVLLATLLLSPANLAVVHGDDDRVALFVSAERKQLNPNTGLDQSTANRLRAVGSVLCRDGSTATAFLVEVSHLLKPTVDAPMIVATASHAFFNNHGVSRGKCWFRRTEWALFAITEIHVGSRKTGDADPRDWAFAQVAKTSSIHQRLDDRFKLQIAFHDQYDFDSKNLSAEDFLNASYMPATGMIGVAKDCKPDDKQKYPWFQQSHHNWSKMIIHDCDFLRSGSGGPLLMRTSTGFEVIGMNIGDADPSKKTVDNVIGVAFNPPHTFNYARRFDTGLKHQLLHMLSDVSGVDALLAQLE